MGILIILVAFSYHDQDQISLAYQLTPKRNRHGEIIAKNFYDPFELLHSDRIIVTRSDIFL
ncbi:hypothetical protein BpHYR1_022176 [Brachionus plicatilis]|uniref:Uncharacterized protein n=1 Tax=Brachionus plicatilis TaxID=10195 RepID=A0A3M7QFY8_BRAPC|nr:hypothetical protein BpHYR1_022176 [Brachionus plicatilis]